MRSRRRSCAVRWGDAAGRAGTRGERGVCARLQSVKLGQDLLASCLLDCATEQVGVVLPVMILGEVNEVAEYVRVQPADQRTLLLPVADLLTGRLEPSKVGGQPSCELHEVVSARLHGAVRVQVLEVGWVRHFDVTHCESDLLQHAHEVTHRGAELAADLLAQGGTHGCVGVVDPVLEAQARGDGLLQARLKKLLVLEGVLSCLLLSASLDASLYSRH